MKTAIAYLEDADRQLYLAQQELRADQRVVYAYRAALRASGAMIAVRSRGRKRALRGTAWERMLAVEPGMESQVKGFMALSRLASRADMGLERELSEDVARSILERSERFVDEIRESLFPAVAIRKGA